MKLFPVSVSVKAAEPLGREAGFKLARDGTGFKITGVIVNILTLEVPPPGVGLNTVRLTPPTEAISAPGIVAVNCVALINVVGRVWPFHCTTEPLMKLLPLTVKAKP